jgi:hypothetical protein
MTSGHECYHCKQWIEAGVEHDCWTTTEQALTRDLPEQLQDAWERLRDTAAGFGEQRIYASHNSIMFSRQACYFFVRPKMTRLEVCIFLGRALKDARVRRAMASSRRKTANMLYVTHRDEIEAPMTDWLREAYEVSPTLGSAARKSQARVAAAKTTGKAKPSRKTKRVTKRVTPRVRARRRTGRRS